jgi:hypothetical protein
MRATHYRGPIDQSQLVVKRLIWAELAVAGPRGYSGLAEAYVESLAPPPPSPMIAQN